MNKVWILAIAAVMLLATIYSASAIDVSACGDLATSGNYVLTQDVILNSNMGIDACVRLTGGGDYDIDCNGHQFMHTGDTQDYPYAALGYGSAIGSLHIHNCVVNSTVGGIMQLETDIFGGSVNNMLIENSLLTSNQAYSDGDLGFFSVNNVVLNNVSWGVGYEVYGVYGVDTLSSMVVQNGTYDASNPFANVFDSTPQLLNNYYVGYSEDCTDVNNDLICDVPFTTTDGFVDSAPRVAPSFCDSHPEALFCDDGNPSLASYWTFQHSDPGYDNGTILLPAFNGIASYAADIDLSQFGSVYNVSFDYVGGVDAGAYLIDEVNPWFLLPAGTHHVDFVYSGGSIIEYVDGVNSGDGVDTLASVFEIENAENTGGDLRIDNFLVQGTSQSCTSSWSCSQYAACTLSNTIACTQVSDANLCNVSFGGDLGTYGGSCVYPTPTPEPGAPQITLVTEANEQPADIQNVTDLVIVVATPQAAQIDFTGESINMTAINISLIPDAVVIEPRRISVRSDLIPELNKPARLTFYGIEDGYHIYKDGVECGSPQCVVVSYGQYSKVLVVDVLGFSEYVIGTYEKSDLKAIIVDGMGTAGAELVSNIDLILIGVILLLIVGMVAKIKEML